MDYGWTNPIARLVIKQKEPCIKCGYNGVTYKYVSSSRGEKLIVTCFGCGYEFWIPVKDSERK